MSEQTLFLAWQDRAGTRQWFPVGQLNADTEHSLYQFRYTEGANRAKQEAQFPLIVDFPDLKKCYRAPALFPLFKNRVISSTRPDFGEYLQNLALSVEADPIEILTIDGGYRTTDSFEVFPKLVKRDDSSFVLRFFLHGSRHVSEVAQQRCNSLGPGDKLHIAVELTNPVTPLAVQIQTDDYHMIGWVPDYLARDLATMVGVASGGYTAHVVRVNPQPAPLRHRVLIEMRGPWDEKREPMSDADFRPLVA